MAVLLMIIAVLSKISGFMRDITLTFFYGATSISDAYIISITITSVLFSLIIAGISTAYIPMFKQIEHDLDVRSAKYFTNNLINILLLITTGIIISGLLFSNVLVKIFALGFNKETVNTAVLFTRIGLVGIYFTSLTQIFIGYLQLNKKFVIPALIGLPFNLIVILSIFISAKTNIIMLAIGTVLAAFIQLLFLIPSLYKSNYRYMPFISFKDKNIKKMAIIAFPIMIGVSIDQINLMVDKTLASTIMEGGISALSYASRLNDFVQGIFVFSFVTVMFPLISKLAANNEMVKFKNSISEVISSVILIVVPACFGLMILAEPLIRLLFGRGNFDENAIHMTSAAMFYYAVGMLGYGIREIINRSFYSLQDMKTPMYNAALSVLLNIILNLILSEYMGISGLALATSISALFCSFLLVISLRKKIGPFGLRSNLITLFKVLLASSGMGIVIYVFNEYILIDWNVFSKISISILIGCIIYIILITLLKVEETKILYRFLKGKFGW
ncbi:murein biosynthesis integral membrane protein MurJ [Psychrobacillus sp. PGGUH221]